MTRKVVEIPVEVWEFSLQDAEHIAALHRETLRLMNENARLKAEVERLEHQVRYWRIEAETDNARWLRCLEDLEKLRKDSQP